jgi:hypothetical protein
MRNDIIIPGFSINVDTSPWEFSFDWKALFTRLFTEELVMRTFRDKLLEAFVPTLEEEKMSPELRKSAFHHHLHNHFYDQRRVVLAAYRSYKYSPKDGEHECARYPCSHEQGRCYKTHPPKRPFDFTPYVYRGGEKLYAGEFENFDGLDNEESMLFQVPNWETLAIRDILQLRVGEEMAEGRFVWPEDLYGHSDQIHGFLCKEFFEDYFIDRKETHLASDVVLEKRLREDEDLDLEAFWP